MSEEVAQCEKFVNKDQLADVMQTQGKMENNDLNPAWTQQKGC